MRVLGSDDLAFATFVAAAMAAALLGLLSLAVWTMVQWPAATPVWPALVLGVAIGAMDRTAGRTRRWWAWVAIVAAVLACGTILAT